MIDPSVDKNLGAGRPLSFSATGSGSAPVRIRIGSSGFGGALPRDEIGLLVVDQRQSEELDTLVYYLREDGSGTASMVVSSDVSRLRK